MSKVKRVKAKRPEVAESSIRQMEKFYKDSSSELINRLIAAALVDRKFKVAELKGYFTKNELSGMLSAFNSTLLELDASLSYTIPPKDLLKAQVEDSCLYENTDKLFEFNLDNLLQKIDALSHSQAFFVVEEIYRFWNFRSGGENAIDEFLAEFTSV